MALVLISDKDEKQKEVAEQLYAFCQENGYEVLLDDRKERPGVKFKDMELIGIPHRITIGRGVQDGQVEYVVRETGEKTNVSLDEVKDLIRKIYA